jgi:hypothetical protein
VPDNPVDRVTVVSSLTTLCLVQMGCVCVKNFFIAHTTMHEQNYFSIKAHFSI